MAITHGTDVGPACKRCAGTIWGYECCAPYTWRAHCATCNAYEYFHTGIARTTVGYVTRQHHIVHSQ